ncbi:type IV pilus biogenesis/stability protein PilW [Shewanella sp. Isolate11]|uniref:type IV pilus biogenesis/stability protein PilW n=1 Tax=Shewanella sp. Isolate11 TaxID=2908530 RepID=UPI001EFD1AA7|nr:type IV pilus biogenesis/stability protein PilW [Shewanella sp. Isolate11]MCG9697213.1 type IV pilus biogenesis/stability protein PilW [Shewanella sp. Isolate11]
MMLQKPKISILILLTSIMVSGCVTERTYSGTDVPITEREFDNVAAARQRVQLGLTYLQKGNSEQAKYNLDKALEYAPKLEAVHIGLAYYYQSVGELELTEQSYRNAINSSDATGDSMNNFGVFLCQQKKYEQSEEMFLRAVKMPKYTRSASSYENLGICSRESGDLTKAQHYFKMALNYDARRAVSLLELAEIELELGNYTEAKNGLARFHRVVPESAASLGLGIKIEQGLNNSEAVKKFGILLLAKFPTSNEAKQYRASMH